MAKIANGSCTPIRKYLRANLRTNRRMLPPTFDRPPYPIQFGQHILLVGSGPVLAAVVEQRLADVFPNSVRPLS